ncbi:hypothetical protein ACOMHN_048766 [Nucella lapillus]
MLQMGVDAVDLILAVEGGKEKALGKVSSEECKSGCVVPGAGVATRGHYGNASTPTTLLVAWEPSWSLDNREDTLTCICLGGGHQYSRAASVKQIPAKKLRFFVNKTQNNIDSNSFLQIHMQVDHNRWVPIGRKLNESRRVTRSFVFYSRINGVVIAKILDTPQVAVVTILISNTSQLFEDPQWECRMVKRITKEKKMYENEAKQLEEKVCKLKTDGADEYVVRKQQEVLQESKQMVPDTLKRLKNAHQELDCLMKDVEEDLAETEEYKAAVAVLQEANAVMDS